MRTLIVCYSLEGNTAFAAEKLAALLGAEVLRLEPEKAYPSTGIKKFFLGGKSAVMGEEPPLKPYAFRGEDWDRIIIGFPVWAGTVAPPIRTFVKTHGGELAGKPVAAFACQSGSGGEKALKKLAALLGREELEVELVLIDPKARPKPEDEEKLADFCEKLS
ncbi:MAG: NAD(P)H-dependent oxidoreductase [Oscillospiraceae bacterium]|nr:NAD(P)H-dependent oxidoreductase [Oscillospiraceae bacterium]